MRDFQTLIVYYFAIGCNKNHLIFFNDAFPEEQNMKPLPVSIPL